MNKRLKQAAALTVGFVMTLQAVSVLAADEMEATPDTVQAELLAEPVVSSLSVSGVFEATSQVRAVYQIEGGAGGALVEWQVSEDGGAFTTVAQGDSLIIDNSMATTINIGNGASAKIRKIRVAVTPMGGQTVYSEEYETAPALGPVNRVTNNPGNQLSTVQENTPEENVFTVGGKDMILLDQGSEGASRYMILAKNFYGLRAVEPKNAGWKGYNLNFNPQAYASDGNSMENKHVAYWLNSSEAGGFLDPESETGLPEAIRRHLDMNHEWRTEANKNMPNDYRFTAGVTLLSLSELKAYADKIGLVDNITAETTKLIWWLRTGYGNEPNSIMFVNGAADKLGQTERWTGNPAGIRPVFWLDEDFFRTEKIDNVLSAGQNVRASPDYSVLAAEDASLLYREAKDERCREMAWYIIEKEWACIAGHYHYPTKQWAGPHGRSYRDIRGNKLWTSLQLALGEQVQLTEELEIDFTTFRFRLECPEKYAAYFRKPIPAYEREIVSRGFTYPHFNMVQTATSYQTEAFTLGTFNRSEMWNQLRPLISYFGTAEQPYCMRMRVLRNFYDFSDSELLCVQDRNTALGIVGFANDRGNTHVCLDMLQDGKVTLSDLRIRFQIEGDLAGIRWEKTEEGAAFFCDSVSGKIFVPYCEFGDFEIRCELKESEEKNISCFDIILYHGEERTICLNDLKRCVCVFGLYMDTTPYQGEGPAAAVSDGIMRARWKPLEKQMEVTALDHADTWELTLGRSRQLLDGEWIIYDAKI